MSALGCSCGRLRCPLCHTERAVPRESAARAEVRRLAAAYRERRDDIIRRGYPTGESWDDAWVPRGRSSRRAVPGAEGGARAYGTA